MNALQSELIALRVTIDRLFGLTLGPGPTQAAVSILVNRARSTGVDQLVADLHALGVRAGTPATEAACLLAARLLSRGSFSLPNLDFHQAERLILEEACRRSDWRIVDAAQLMGITRHAFKRRLVKHGLVNLFLASRSSRATLPESTAPS